MKRSEIDIKYKWNSDEIISSKDEFISRVKKVVKLIDFKSFKGK